MTNPCIYPYFYRVCLKVNCLFWEEILGKEFVGKSDVLNKKYIKKHECD